MANRKNDSNFLFNPALVAEKLTDLRKGDGINSITLEQLSDGILKKTGVYISAVQLGKYENSDLKERININNLLALASYYGVTIDYILGHSESKSSNSTDKHTAKKFGLSDRAMGFLSLLKEEKDIYVRNPKSTLNLINFVLENYSFWNEFEKLLSDYADAKVPEKIVKEILHEGGGMTVVSNNNGNADMVSYLLTKLFERLSDACCDNLYHGRDVIGDEVILENELKMEVLP